jgi:hypothetical protein
LREVGQTCVLLANLSADEQSIEVQNICGPAQVRVLDETNVEFAMRQPEAFRAQAGTEIEVNDGRLQLLLKPYAVARILCPNV